MSANPVTPTQAVASRPGTLTTAIGVAVLTAVAAMVNGIMIASGGADLISDILIDAGVPAEAVTTDNLESTAVLAGYGSLEEFESTFAMRGYLALAGGVALVLFGLAMGKAATWARSLVTVAAALSIAFAGIVVADETTTTMALLSFGTMLGSVLVIIFTWLPANGRYAKAAA